jgi:hypothetical protein
VPVPAPAGIIRFDPGRNSSAASALSTPAILLPRSLPLISRNPRPRPQHHQPHLSDLRKPGLEHRRHAFRLRQSFFCCGFPDKAKTRCWVPADTSTVRCAILIRHAGSNSVTTLNSVSGAQNVLQTIVPDLHCPSSRRLCHSASLDAGARNPQRR